MEDIFGSCTIYSLSHEAEGIGEFEGKTIHIPFSLPGERIAFKQIGSKKRKKFLFQSVENASDSRVIPVCRHFTQCGGCTLQHMNSDLYREFKKSLITIPLQEHGLDPFLVDDIIILPFGKRRRANLDIIKKNDVVYLGFHRWKSHQIIDLKECHTLSPALKSLLDPFKVALNLILDNFQKAKIFLTETGSGVDFSFEIQGVLELAESQREILKSFAMKNKVARFVFKHGKKIDCIYKTTDPVVVFDGVDVAVDAYSFLQATEEADTILTSLVMENVPGTLTKAADLFCGRGTFSFPLSRIAAVDGFELDKPALKALEDAVSKSQRNITAYQRNLFEDPLSTKELNSYEMVIIDPPRAGAFEQVKTLKDSLSQTIVYVSCNPQTFARDAKELVNGGYTLKKVTGVDQFAWSAHLEIVGVFVK
ncbi:MAG: 23S rRNA (uracil(1939)-C(5))-methyltransferase RlmD [Alphaproteobacteria bacterium]|nr:23S rRNA (uracil(1939)-C(5))-methyltransferase RlmD [Alphaproteobacteria bacterium]